MTKHVSTEVFNALSPKTGYRAQYAEDVSNPCELKRLNNIADLECADDLVSAHEDKMRNHAVKYALAQCDRPFADDVHAE